MITVFFTVLFVVGCTLYMLASDFVYMNITFNRMIPDVNKIKKILNTGIALIKLPLVFVLMLFVYNLFIALDIRAAELLVLLLGSCVAVLAFKAACKVIFRLLELR